MLGSPRSTKSNELIQSLQSVWRNLQPYLRELSPELREQLQQFSKALTGDLDRDNDQRNKEDVYRMVARFLRDRFGRPEDVCLAVVHRLCGEKDEVALGMAGEPHGDAPDPLAAGNLETELRKTILAINVRYEERERFRTFIRRVEIYSNPTDTGVDRAAFEQEIPWESLPSEVREQQMRDPKPSQTFVLYRKEAA